ncbi:MAG: hypothetical protein KKE17_08150 [Proteobacteria bacterium]|nr:hypothetical protein [Pseudomonadota bacterium]MBU1709958.1 hypothetical protein [Pseudomonadota bacterium]
MKRYRLLVNGRNVLLNRDGKIQKYGFYQNFFIKADNLKQAELLVSARIFRDKNFAEIILNSKDDMPKIHFETFWELDNLEYVGDYIVPDRTYYVEKKWWQFWV